MRHHVEVLTFAKGDLPQWNRVQTLLDDDDGSRAKVVAESYSAAGWWRRRGAIREWSLVVGVRIIEGDEKT